MNAGAHAEQGKTSKTRTALSFVAVLVFALALAWLLREFFLQPYEIPSGSMEPTILVDDKIFSEKLSYYTSDIKAGDIVTFNDTEIPGRVLIKRCIATEGQEVRLGDDGELYIDNVKQEESYTNGLPSYRISPSLEPISYPYTVPEDCIWVMGDNRTNSKDSRYFGAVETSRVTGKAFMIYWPLYRTGLLG